MGLVKVIDGRVAARGLGQTGQQGNLRQVEGGGGFVEIGQSSGLDAVGSLTEINMVEIDIEDLIFSEQPVDSPGQDRLLELP